MPPGAICSGNCGYVFDIEEEKAGPTGLAPVRCPKCRKKLIRWCPRCWAPLTDVTAKRPACAFCGGDLLKLAKTGLLHAPLRRAVCDKGPGASSRKCG